MLSCKLVNGEFMLVITYNQSHYVGICLVSTTHYEYGWDVVNHYITVSCTLSHYALQGPRLLWHDASGVAVVDVCRGSLVRAQVGARRGMEAILLHLHPFTIPVHNTYSKVTVFTIAPSGRFPHPLPMSSDMDGCCILTCIYAGIICKRDPCLSMTSMSK